MTSAHACEAQKVREEVGDRVMKQNEHEHLRATEGSRRDAVGSIRREATPLKARERFLASPRRAHLTRASTTSGLVVALLA